MTNDSNPLSEMDLATLRVKYEHLQLCERDFADNPLGQFQAWLAEAAAAGISEPNAMIVSTADLRGRPSARHVLLKSVDSRGFVFFTNYDSRKGRELAANPHLALTFSWLPLFRQVVVEGVAEKVSREESEQYFQTRPYGSKIGAWASLQSQPMESAEEFELRYAEYSQEFPEGSVVPTPTNWGGYLVRASSVEFWAGHESRLHDRWRYLATDLAELDDANAWHLQRYYP